MTLSVGQPAYQVAILGRLVLGLYVARALIFTDLKSHTVLLRTVLIVGAIVGLGGNVVLAAQVLDSAATAGGFFFPFLRGLITELAYLGLTLAYASGLALLFQTIRGQRYLLMLAPIGRQGTAEHLKEACPLL